jgi:hypothetical protein
VDWVQTILSDPIGYAFTDGTAFHWVQSVLLFCYVSIRFSTINLLSFSFQYSGPQFENLAKAHSLYPEKFLLATEATTSSFIHSFVWRSSQFHNQYIIE